MKAHVRPMLVAAAAVLAAVGVAFAEDRSPASLSPAAAPNSWAATATLGAPSKRFLQRAVWTGSKMIVWGGGAESYNSFGDGGLYDPLTNKWKAVGSFNAPSAREANSAIWTGSRMIVWGGVGFHGAVLSNTVYNDGGIYDPESDTWTRVAALGAPSPRCYHTAVWTGSEMIVWGGSSKAVSSPPTDYHDLNTGGIYEPVSNTWRPISTAGAPSPRDRQTALWTGSRMIIWGGDDGKENDLSTGGIYDPVTDSWEPTSNVGAPSGRDDNAGVWADAKMIVWGGYAGDHVTDTGGIYDPVADSWTATSTAGAPSARELVNGIALRGHLIVFGGWNGHADVNTGGIYDPESDTWTATPILGAPSGREEASAVSTGSAMIVWGGYDGDHNVNSGGVYTPPNLSCLGSRGCIIPAQPPDQVRIHPRP